MTIDISAFRTSLCTSLIAAGVTGLEELKQTVSGLESFVFDTASEKDTQLTNAETSEKHTPTTNTETSENEALVIQPEATDVTAETAPIAVTKDDVIAALKALAVREGGRELAGKILDKHGVKAISGLNESQYAAVLNDIKAA